eukprot:6770419-Prymnesium_polylepis.3
MAPRAAHRSSHSSWSVQNLENPHDRGEARHRRKRFRTCGTAAAHHRPEAAWPIRRARMVGSTSYSSYSSCYSTTTARLQQLYSSYSSYSSHTNTP